MDPTIELLDKKIEEVESRIERIKAALGELPSLEADLNALQRSKAIVLGRPKAEREASKTIPPVRQEGMTLSDAILAVLSESRSPVNHEQMMTGLRGLGIKPNVNSVWGTLARFARDGKIVRKDKGLYASK